MLPKGGGGDLVGNESGSDDDIAFADDDYDANAQEKQEPGRIHHWRVTTDDENVEEVRF